MSDDLLDTTDIFKIKSLGNSPLNENIESQDKMQQIIAEFDETVREVQPKFTYEQALLSNQVNMSTDNLTQSQIQDSLEDSSSIQSQSRISSKISINEDQPMQEEVDVGQISFMPFREISQSQLKNSMQINEEKEQSKQSERPFSVKDDILGGMQLSYVDFSKKIFQQYRQQSISQQQQQQQQQQSQSQQEPIAINQPTQIKNIDNKENEIEVARKDCLEKGMGKIRELGDTIKSSINQMHEKFNEVKGCVSQLVEEDKYKDLWDNRLNEFYQKLFNQASKALFISSTGTPSKIITQKPQSVYRFSTKTSVSKPLSTTINPLQNKKPGSVTKFNVPSMLNRPKSVVRGPIQANTSTENNATNNNSSQPSRQKSFTVQKFNTSKTPVASNHFGVLKTSKDIKKDSVKKTPTIVSKPSSTSRLGSGKENITFFKK